MNKIKHINPRQGKDIISGILYKARIFYDDKQAVYIDRNGTVELDSAYTRELFKCFTCGDQLEGEFYYMLTLLSPHLVYFCSKSCYQIKQLIE